MSIFHRNKWIYTQVAQTNPNCPMQMNLGGKRADKMWREKSLGVIFGHISVQAS